MKSSLSEIQNSKRKHASASEAVVGSSELRQADGRRVRIGQDVHRRAEKPVSVLPKRTAARNVRFTFAQLGSEDDHNNAERDHG